MVFFSPTENTSYSSVRTEALTVVDLIVKRTGGKFNQNNSMKSVDKVLHLSLEFTILYVPFLYMQIPAALLFLILQIEFKSFFCLFW